MKSYHNLTIFYVEKYQFWIFLLECHTSAPLKRKRIVFFKAVSDCVMTSRTSSIIAQLTASSLAPGLWGTESKWQLTGKKHEMYYLTPLGLFHKVCLFVFKSFSPLCGYSILCDYKKTLGSIYRPGICGKYFPLVPSKKHLSPEKTETN